MSPSSRGSVLIIVENLPVPFDRRVWIEATTLKEAGYDVSVICPIGKGLNERYDIIDDIHIYRHPLPKETGSKLNYIREYATALYWEFRLAWKVKRERGFDIIHICNPPDLLFLIAGWHKIFSGVRVVFDHHDVNPELYEQKYHRQDILYHGLRFVERLTFAIADVVLSTNTSYREIALRRGGQTPSNVFVVRSAPNLHQFKPLPIDPSLKKGRTYLVGYVGIMGEQDGVDYLLQAVEFIVHHAGRTDIQFHLIGGGPALNDLIRLSRSLGVEDFVEFVGFRSGDDLLTRLSTCDICVSPDPRNTYNDICTMNKTLEYMALAKPIVQFDLTEGRQSAADASLYADPNDTRDFARKILKLADSPALRERLGLIGRRRMESHLEWRHQAPNLLAAYRQLELP